MAKRQTKARPAGGKPTVYYVIVTITAALFGIGLVMSTSASAVLAYLEHADSFHFFWRQAIFGVAGVAALLIASKMPREWLKALSPLGLVVSFVLLIAVYLVGEESGGATRWLSVAGLRFQPSEVAKMAAVLFSADILARKRVAEDRLSGLLLPLGLPLVTLCVLIFRQPDLGTTIIVAVALLFMLYLADIRARELVGLTAVGLAAGIAATIVAPYRMARWTAFWDPWAVAQGAGYQLVQAQMAFGSGGWTGVGLGMSRQKFGYLPEPYTDFIFAVIGEEMGLLGALTVALLYFGLAFAIIHVMRTCDDLFSRLLVGGIGAVIVGQAFINIGGVISVIPLTGVTLPLISIGGTSLVVTMAGIGIILNFAQSERKGKRSVQSDDSDLRRRNRRAHISRPRPGRSA